MITIQLNCRELEEAPTRETPSISGRRRPEALLERAQKYLSRCEGAISGSGGHNTTFRVVNALVHGFCLSAETAYQLLREVYNPKCSPPWRDAELRHKTKSACNTEPIKGRGYLLNNDFVAPAVASVDISPPTPKPVFDPDYLAAFTAQLPDSVTVDPQYLEIRSQFTCHNRAPAEFLHKIFREGEHVWVTDKPKSCQGLIWTHEGLVQNLAELDHLRTGRPGVWFLSNPIDGAHHELERLKSEFNPLGVSFRATECVTNWRHAVLETDEASENLWLKALVLLELPIVAIYHSGKRGAHALVNLGEVRNVPIGLFKDVPFALYGGFRFSRIIPRYLRYTTKCYRADSSKTVSLNYGMSLNSTRGIQLYQCMNLNKVLLAGRLTREVELHYTPKATPVVEIGVAINRFFTSNDGQKKEETTFVDVTLWSRQAEIAQRYLHKGSPVFIEGRLQLDTWEDKQSCQKRSRLRVVGENMQLLGSKEGAAATPREPVPGQTRVPQASTTIPSGRGAGVPDPDLDAKPRLGKPAFALSAEPGKPATPTETRAAGFLAILTSSLLSDELKATHQTDDRDHARTGSRRRRRARTLRYSPHYLALPLRAFAYEAF